MATAQTFATASLLGFAGSEQSSDALEVLCHTARRALPALYNAPGSYGAGKGCIALSEAQVWEGHHPGVSADPTALTSRSDASNGPKYIATFSGTVMTHTGPIAKLILETSRAMKPLAPKSGRVTKPLWITVVDLESETDTEEHPVAAVSAPVILPIVASAAAAAACGASGDWYSFAMILTGMACNGMASFFLQKGDLTFTRPAAAPGAPRGDGYLEAGNEIIVLKGSEGAVTAVTRGEFTLRFKSDSQLKKVKIGGILLTIQCFVQLLFVPFGTIFGQILFLASMAISWLFNAYVASQEKKAWKHIALKGLLRSHSMERYGLGTRTAAAVFLMKVLKPDNVEEQLTRLLPNNTPVWTAWRRIVVQGLRKGNSAFVASEAEKALLSADQHMLFQTLIDDANDAVRAFDELVVQTKY